MRGRRTTAGAAVVAFGFLAFAGGAPVGADHADLEPGAGLAGWFQEYGFPGRDRPAVRPVRNGVCECDGDRDGRCARKDPDCRDANSGTPWVVMRRFLVDEDPCAPWHRHAGCWFLRRWPVKTLVLAGRECAGQECDERECPLALAAADAEIAPASNEERMLRGLERFRLGRTESATEDFRAAATADPTEPRAQYGVLMCAFVAGRWKESAEALRALAGLGALAPGDRIDTAVVFEDPDRMRSLIAGLESYAKWSFHDDDASLTLAWALLTTGRVEQAGPHLRAASRWNADDPAVAALRVPVPAAVTEEAPPADR
jgi:hypothetical protein